MTPPTPATLAALHAASFIVPPPWSEAAFAGLLADPVAFLLAEPAGFALGRVALDEAELLTLAVAAEARRQGRGRALLTAFEAEAQARGAITAFLEVAADNAAAIALYRSAGFAEAGRRRGYYRIAGAAPVDALVMAKSLGAQENAGPA